MFGVVHCKLLVWQTVLMLDGDTTRCLPNRVMQTQAGARENGFRLVEILAECRNGMCAVE